MNFNEKIIALRKSRNLSQEELGQEIGVTRQVIYRWEKGLVMTSVDNLISLGEFFGVSVDSLVKDELSVGDENNRTAEASVEAKNDLPSETASADDVSEKPTKIRVNGKIFAAVIVAVFLVVTVILGIITAIIQSRIPSGNGVLYITLRLNKLSFLVPFGIIAAIPLYILIVYLLVWAIKAVRYRINKFSDKERNGDEDNGSEQT